MRGEHTGKVKVDQVAHIDAAVEGVRDNISLRDMAKRNGLLSRGTLQLAYLVVKEAPDLVDQIKSGEITVYKAGQIVRQGEMVPCPVCGTKGYIFRKRKSV